MRILCVHSLIKKGEGNVTFGAVEYHRMHKPHLAMSREGHSFVTIDDIELCPDDFLKQFDIVLFCRMIRNAHVTAERLNKLNIIFGLDLDDYWHLPTEHILNKFYEVNNVPQIIQDSIKLSGFVIVTTEILADKVKPINGNVHIVENGIDTADINWQPNKISSNRLRFGFTQGNTHLADIAEIAHDVVSAFSDDNFYKSGQVIVFGFNAEKNKGSAYIGYERMLTNNLEAIKDQEYVKRLKNIGSPNGISKPYRRVWGMEISEYPRVYNEIDISVVPLKVSEFNSCKSNLKMLEAGFMNCAIMVSEVDPYTPLATNENSFLLSKRTFNEWQKYIFANPNILSDKRAALKDAVKPYSLELLTKKRIEIYESCICLQQ